ncbi:hypothetical protein [Mitsuaria sp. GD03876]|uniref:hypothetical protein n=1 Tax=Mitsuaria sp. GD03876 TaxID=2975399 RepID=UPI002448C136|nr:hypothetical protein [Mitsuaria sp. GD03876]MDH0864534.1 hypothetical protein [Mitsuaria sp. GD03876]
MHIHRKLGSLALLMGTLCGAPAFAEAPLVEDNGAVALRTIQTMVEPMMRGKIDPAAKACMQALPADSYHAVMRKFADRLSIEDQAQIDAFLRTPIGRKFTLRLELQTYVTMKQPLPEPMPEWTAEDKRQLDQAATVPAVRTYLQSGLIRGTQANGELNLRTRELLTQCKVVPPGSAAVAATTYKPGGVGTESRDAAMGAIGTANFVIGRIGRECLALLKRSDTPQAFVAAWKQRNQSFADASVHYFDKRLTEAEAEGGNARKEAVMREFSAAVQRNGATTVQNMLDRPDREAACSRAVQMVEMGAFDFNPTMPMFDELQALVAWAKANP